MLTKWMWAIGVVVMGVALVSGAARLRTPRRKPRSTSRWMRRPLRLRRPPRLRPRLRRRLKPSPKPRPRQGSGQTEQGRREGHHGGLPEGHRLARSRRKRASFEAKVKDEKGVEMGVDVTPDGMIVEVETAVAEKDLPAAVAKAVTTAVEGAKIVKAEKHVVRAEAKDGKFVETREGQDPLRRKLTTRMASPPRSRSPRTARLSTP